MYIITDVFSRQGNVYLMLRNEEKTICKVCFPFYRAFDCRLDKINGKDLEKLGDDFRYATGDSKGWVIARSNAKSRALLRKQGIKTAHDSDLIRWFTVNQCMKVQFDDGVHSALEELVNGDLDKVRKMFRSYGYGELRKRKGMYEVVLDSEGHLKEKAYLTPDEFLSLPSLFIDIEVPLFMDEDYTIRWVGCLYAFGNQREYRIFTLNDLCLKDVTIQKAGNEKELVKLVKEYILEKDPFVIYVYNAAFDLVELRERGDFRPGWEKSKPGYQSRIKFFERFKMRGRLIIDLLSWAKIALGFLPDKKLDTVARYFNIGKKELSYEELAACEKAVIGGDIEKGRAIVEYLLGDLELLEKLIGTEHYRRYLDFAFRVAPFGATLSKLMHSHEALFDCIRKEFYEREGRFFEEVFRRTKNDFELIKENKQKFARIFSGMFKLRQGVYKSVFLCYAPIGTELVRELTKRYPKLEKLLEMYKNAEDWRERYFLSLQLYGACRHLVNDYIMAIFGKLSHERFNRRYFTSVRKVNQILREFAEKLEKAVLYARGFYCICEKPSKELEVIALRELRNVVITKKGIVYYIDDKRVFRGRRRLEGELNECIMEVISYLADGKLREAALSAFDWLDYFRSGMPEEDSYKVKEEVILRSKRAFDYAERFLTELLETVFPAKIVKMILGESTKVEELKKILARKRINQRRFF
ncbi:hypothetical protein KY307_02420 [Candidatus Woesearchaeota archaeon]|nr:hypothetical protein [Candidatus Woesearchaeota archaeon]